MTIMIPDEKARQEKLKQLRIDRFCFLMEEILVMPEGDFSQILREAQESSEEQLEFPDPWDGLVVSYTKRGGTRKWNIYPDAPSRWNLRAELEVLPNLVEFVIEYASEEDERQSD